MSDPFSDKNTYTDKEEGEELINPFETEDDIINPNEAYWTSSKPLGKAVTAALTSIFHLSRSVAQHVNSRQAEIESTERLVRGKISDGRGSATASYTNGGKTYSLGDMIIMTRMASNEQARFKAITERIQTESGKMCSAREFVTLVSAKDEIVQLIEQLRPILESANLSASAAQGEYVLNLQRRLDVVQRRLKTWCSLAKSHMSVDDGDED